MPNAPVAPNAPDDLLAPKAAELIAWCEEEIARRWQGHEGVYVATTTFDEDDNQSQGPLRPATAADMPEHVRQLRAVITLLRERDALAKALLERESEARARLAVLTTHPDDWADRDRAETSCDAANDARHAIAKLHATEP